MYGMQYYFECNREYLASAIPKRDVGSSKPAPTEAMVLAGRYGPFTTLLHDASAMKIT